MHLFQQHAVKDLAKAAEEIPVIDYGPYFAGESGALERLAEQVRYACENIGFLYASTMACRRRSSIAASPHRDVSMHCRSKRS